jgi:hypothetical protein
MAFELHARTFFDACLKVLYFCLQLLLLFLQGLVCPLLLLELGALQGSSTTQTSSMSIQQQQSKHEAKLLIQCW